MTMQEQADVYEQSLWPLGLASILLLCTAAHVLCSETIYTGMQGLSVVASGEVLDAQTKMCCAVHTA